MNIVEPILFQARHDPPAPAMCAPGTALGVVSYARLARFIHSVGHRAIRAGIAPRNVVAIQVKDHIFHTALALGLMHIGAATVSVGDTFPPGLRADVIVTDTPQSFGNGKSAKVVPVDMSWMSGKGVPVDESRVYNGGGNDICRIALTSGSTGEAKAVGFTHNNQLARLARYNHVFGKTFPECSRFFSDYGLGSSGGFRHILYVLSRGGTMFFPGASPMETLQTFELYKVQGLIASPGGLSGILNFYDANSDFRCGFDVIISAEPIAQFVVGTCACMCSNLIFIMAQRNIDHLIRTRYVLKGIAGAAGFIAPDVSVKSSTTRGNCCLKARRVDCVRHLSASTDISMTLARLKCRSSIDISIPAIRHVTPEKMLIITGGKRVLNPVAKSQPHGHRGRAHNVLWRARGRGLRRAERARH